MNCGSENEEIIDVETEYIDNTTAEINVKDNSTLKTTMEHLLFKPSKIRVKEYWTFMSLVAPRTEAGKAWKSSDAVSAYCSKCDKKIPWSIKNPKHVQRHMEKFHHKFLAESKKRKNRTVDAVESKPLGFFRKKQEERFATSTKERSNKRGSVACELDCHVLTTIFDRRRFRISPLC